MKKLLLSAVMCLTLALGLSLSAPKKAEAAVKITDEIIQSAIEKNRGIDNIVLFEHNGSLYLVREGTSYDDGKYASNSWFITLHKEQVVLVSPNWWVPDFWRYDNGAWVLDSGLESAALGSFSCEIKLEYANKIVYTSKNVVYAAACNGHQAGDIFYDVISSSYYDFGDDIGSTEFAVEMTATEVNVIVPLNVACVINPNVDPSFVHGDMAITNDSYAPVRLYVNLFRATGDKNMILPTGLPDGLIWADLDAEKSAQYLSVGVKAADDGSWLSVLNENFVYANNLAGKSPLGIIRARESGKLSFEAYHGFSFATEDVINLGIGFVAEVISE